jgi:hypothetical protein
VIIFSMVSIYLTSLWNYGFSFNKEPLAFFKTGLIIAIIFYLILPLAKIVLIPLNALTLGLASLVFYFAILHFLSTYSIVAIKPWEFYGLSFWAIHIPKISINYLANLFLSALSISTIINLLENIL